MLKSFLLIVFGFLAIVSVSHQCIAEQPISVCYLQLSAHPSGEDSTALAWLRARPQFHLTILQPGAAHIQPSGIMWVYLPDTAAFIALSRQSTLLTTLQAFARAGGRLLLTDYAALLPFQWGIESQKPSIRIDTVAEEGLFDKKGFQSYRGHPLFDGLHNGEYILNPRRAMVYHQIGFFGNDYPAVGKVVAVDKSYITIHKDKKLVIEYSHGSGRMLAVGSSILFNLQNDLQPNLDRFMENAFMFLAAPKHASTATYWVPQTLQPQLFVPTTLAAQPSTAQPALQQSNDIVLRDTGSTARFFDAAGRRIVAMGNEHDGIEEIWAHPFRIVHDYHAGLVLADTLAPLSAFPVQVEVRPESFTRIYSIPGGTLKEIIAASFDKPGVMARYEFNSTIPIRLRVSLRPGMRLMWPYDADAFGGMRYGYDSATHVLHVKDSTASFYSLFGADVTPEHSKTIVTPMVIQNRRKGRMAFDSELELLHESDFVLDREGHTSLDYILVGTSEGFKAAAETFIAMKRNAIGEIEQTSAAYQSILNSRTTIQSPDSFFNLYYKWSLIGSNKFIATTPGVGTGLLAGYATTARGWDGGQKISGRPGYAWYFGRDSEWSGLAFDAIGDFETVRNQLTLLQQWQDRSGKIFHELTTSGVEHYDASDATPLYLVLAADYLRSSGDTAFIRTSWPHLKTALDYLYTTDTDHDGLIENTNQGHGWMESGALFPMHTETYLAGVWGKALQGMAEIAQNQNLSALHEQYQRDAERVIKLLNTDFWIDSLNFASFGKWDNGSYSTERGIAPAIPALFGFFDRPKGLALAAAYASSLFATDWGVHLISRDSKLFSPAGYDYGSVYPLFTGWAALAEYRYGRSAEAFSHIYENLRLKSFWSLGYSPEVIHGLQYLPSGVDLPPKK